MKVYCVYDKVAQEGGPLFEAKNDNVANRHFQAITSETFRPDDFSLMYLGIYKREECAIMACDEATEVLITVNEELEEE